MNAEEFKIATGREPVNDDLERANCTKAGSPGHRMCGVCGHNKPAFECQACWEDSLSNEFKGDD